MCDFNKKNPPKVCLDRSCKEYVKAESDCPTCEETAIHMVDYCGMGTCEAAIPCGSETCCFAKHDAPPCTADICPYEPVIPGPCVRDDGMTCDIYGDVPCCMMDDDNRVKKDYLSKFQYKDFTKHTFNKSKYLPSSYLPGDGADYSYGYGLEPTASELGGGPCGSPCCPMASLDYLLDKLNKPLTLPTLQANTTTFDYCGGPICPYGPPKATCPFAPPIPQPCPFAKPPNVSAPKEPKKKKQGCGAPDCKFAKKEPCGAPDCPYRDKKPCGAPDCKYGHGEEEIEDPCAASSKKKKKRKSQGDFDSNGSCDSGVCPFAGLKKASDEGSGISCDNPDCPFAHKEGECTDKTCPYAKELVICQDCGGIILEETDAVPIDLAPSFDAKDDKGEERGAIRSSVEVSEKPRKPSIPKVERQPSGSKKPSVSEEAEVKTKPKQKVKKKDVMYTYPGVEAGHKFCMKKRKNIPSNMGWAWNKKPVVGDPELWRGYKPGAISKTVHRMIRAHRRAAGILDPSELLRKKKSKISNRAQNDKNKRCIEVEKKAGSYFVTVNPVKDPNTLQDFESPYVECTPMQFKIIKPEKPEKKPKQIDEETGCLCDLEEEVESYDSSSDNSELKFSFSPPAALPDLKPRKKKVKHTIDTQYDPKDFTPPKPSKGDLGKKGEGSKKGKGKKGKK